MVTAPVLQLPDFTQPFEIECDAFGKGIRVVLMQSKHPIAYFSKAFSRRSLAKSAYEREIMALAMAVQHWRPYLLGRKFKVFSDQKSLGHLLQQRITTTDQQNWVAKLLGYNFEITYKPGKENRAADALSRREEGTYHSLISFPTWDKGFHIVQEANQDPEIQKIKFIPASRMVFSIIKGSWSYLPLPGLSLIYSKNSMGLAQGAIRGITTPIDIWQTIYTGLA